MKRLLISLLAAAAFLPALAPARDDPRIASGKAAADTWLALTDAGAYEASWNQASPSFQAAIPKATWLTGIAQLRDPLGHVVERDPSSARVASSIANAPDGEYVSIVYESEFENRKEALETVTTKHEKDGSWKVMGYQLQ